MLIDPVDNKHYTSRDVEFDEENFSFGFGRTAVSPMAINSNPVPASVDIPVADSATLENLPVNLEFDQAVSEGENSLEEEKSLHTLHDSDSDDHTQDYASANSHLEDDDGISDSDIAPRRSSRISRPPGEWWKSQQANCALLKTCDLPRPDITSLKTVSVLVPQSVTQAMSSSEGGHWLDAMQSEYRQMQDFNTWSLEELPRDRKAIGCKWVFNVKPSLVGDGCVRKFKARLVIKGFSQRPGIDYSETFSPVAHAESFRIIMALSAQQGLFLRQIDVVGAFLNGDIDGDIYMKQPDGFTVSGKERLVCKLSKALYGLKQAGMIWNQQLDNFLVDKLHFRRTIADPCVYFQKQDNFMAIILVHVDDIIIAHNDLSLCDSIVSSLKSKWNVTDLGEPSRVLGMQLERSDQTGSIFLHQQEYIEELLVRFNMKECKTVPTPHQPGHYLSTTMSPSTEEERTDMKTVPYSELVGSLNWLATSTRPDIANAVGTLCRFISNPGRQHWTAAQRVLRYLSGTSEFGLRFSISNSDDISSLYGYSDADWAGDPDTRRSTTGFVFTVHGAPVSWKSKLQQSSALSSVEAEYIALCGASREAKWIRQLLFEINQPEPKATIIYDDNKGCISVSGNNRTDSRTKHIDVKYHYVRQMILNQQIKIEYLPTQDMIADIFTKPTSTATFSRLRPRLVSVPAYGLRGRVEDQTNNVRNSIEAPPTTPCQDQWAQPWQKGT